jgi:hypothetical protein
MGVLTGALMVILTGTVMEPPVALVSVTVAL